MFKLPVFVGGVCAAEFIRIIDWNIVSSDHGYTTNAIEVPPDVNENSEKRVGKIVQRWVLPFVLDLFMVVTTLLIFRDIRMAKSEEARFHHRMAEKVAAMIGYRRDTLGLWTFRSPFAVLPFVSVVLVLLANPFAYRSLTWKILVHKCALQILPGRSAFLIALFYPLLLDLLPTEIRDDIFRGSGLYLSVFILFATAIPTYYYVYQPWHLWVTLRLCPPITCALGDNKEQVVQTPSVMKDDEVPGFSGIFASPNYDPFYPNNEEAERCLYKHVQELALPKTGREAKLWFINLFFVTQAQNWPELLM